MIYIIGDCYQNFERFNNNIFSEQKKMSKEDYVIICGDFGGASSHDIDGGILEPDDPDFKRKKKILDKGWHPHRIEQVSWWEQEIPSENEMEEGRKNLVVHHNNVDFIVTHCCSSGTQNLLGGAMHKPDIVTAYLEEIHRKVKFKKYFCTSRL